MAKIKQAELKSNRRLSSKVSFAIIKKMRGTLPKEIEPETRLFGVALETAIFDISSRLVPLRRAAWHFLFNSSEDFSRVCDLAGYDPDYILRLVNTATEYEDSKEVEAA